MIDKRTTVTATPVGHVDTYRDSTTAIVLELHAKNAALESQLAELRRTHTKPRAPFLSEETKASLVLVGNICWLVMNALLLVLCFLAFLIVLVSPGGHVPRPAVLFITSMGVVNALKYLRDWANS
jgi:hypothetical protein